jgi:hypothetical protein
MDLTAHLGRIVFVNLVSLSPARSVDRGLA